jgi:hypothetical protein
LLDSNSFIDEYKAVPEIRHFLTPEGKDIYSDWHRKLRDTKAKIALDRRINRIELGNFGDHKFCRDGVWELRVLTLDKDTGGITRSPKPRSSCCSVEAASGPRIRTSTALANIGRTGKGEPSNERQNTR